MNKLIFCVLFTNSAYFFTQNVHWKSNIDNDWPGIFIVSIYEYFYFIRTYVTQDADDEYLDNIVTGDETQLYHPTNPNKYYSNNAKRILQNTRNSKQFLRRKPRILFLGYKRLIAIINKGLFKKFQMVCLGLPYSPGLAPSDFFLFLI